MGCGGSKADEPAREPSLPPVEYLEAAAVDERESVRAHRRLEKLVELDKATKVPFILIEITGEGPGDGEIEVCGKNEYGVYEALDEFFMSKWNCERMDPGDLNVDTKVPFCSAQYRWPGYITSGEEGLSNMGLMSMRVIDFVCSRLSWTLAVINGGNVGRIGDVRETQLVFKAPHPMNLVVPHMMIELRSAGYIEVCADMEEEHLFVLDDIENYFKERFQAEPVGGHEQYCDRYYTTGDGVFKGTSGSADSNFGLLSTEVCDKVANFDGWSLVACNSGNYGETGEHCEQQLVFRRDYHPLGSSKYLQIILNELGNIEVNGQKQKEIHTQVNKFLMKHMHCQQAGELWEQGVMCRRYNWNVKAPDMLRAASDVTSFFEQIGWEMQLCSQQMIKEEGQRCRETQLFFRPGKTDVGTIEPHLFLELYAGEGKEEFFEDEESTQVLANQRIRMRTIGSKDTDVMKRAEQALESWISEYLEASFSPEESSALPGTKVYICNVFLCRGKFENNLAQWTMRMCDFMVDSLGWNFVVCSLCNMGELGNIRSQQLVFHYDGEKREIPLSMVDPTNQDTSEWADMPFPDHWTNEQVLSRQIVQSIAPCGEDIKMNLQAIVDASYKRVLTRDRRPDDEAPDNEEMPYRLDIVQVFRSEHASLNYRFQLAHADVPETFPLRTGGVSPDIDGQLLAGDGYLFHGTNPSSAMNILRTGFVLDHAGHTTGTMYGPGIYMAERSSKADEYSKDDGGNTYPSLHAILVCRCFVGTPLVVDKAGPHTQAAIEQGLHSVCGDRESKVGTYREFIFFNEAQVYPEYAVIYRRQYDKNLVPEHMRTAATGTTGRFWQSKGPDGWRNLPMEVNKMLIEKQAIEGDGPKTVRVRLGGTEYEFDVVEKKGTNVKTGNVVPLRAPMVR